jgi:hypothetical protein
MLEVPPLIAGPHGRRASLRSMQATAKECV